jgi:hypothetical protein
MEKGRHKDGGRKKKKKKMRKKEGKIERNSVVAGGKYRLAGVDKSTESTHTLSLV